MQKIQQEPIAIIGIGCRFPGAETPNSFWQALRQGEEAISEVPAHRWKSEALYSPDSLQPGRMACKWGGFIENVDQFDWRMFHMLPREARYMDPQHRLLLEVTWEALEDAGIPLTEVAGSQTSVAVGINWNDYLRLQARNWSRLDGYTAVGTPFAFAANRLSHFFDLRGQSIALDTACSSSLMALHLACQSLWTGEATLALAGGVNLHLSPDSWIIASKTGLLSRTGHCRTLDASADGFVFGEGAGMVVLKPFSLLQPSDRVYALIRGVAVNHNGHNEWIMAASQEAQENLLREAYRKAGVNPAEVDYVELHGTGFLKGDAIESRALGAVVGRQEARQHPCLIGSVKTNIGHLSAASGIAGIIKVALSLYNQELPPTLHLQAINPDIPLAELQLAPQRELTPWPVKKEGKPLAGVTALALTGANAHVILEGHHVAMQSSDEQAQLCLLPLSAASKPALWSQVAAFKYMLMTTEDSWQDICYTAGARRDHYQYRLGIIACNTCEGAKILDMAPSDQMPDFTDALPEGLLLQDADPKTHKLVFVFAGQGIDWTQIDLAFLHRDPLYQQVINKCRRAITDYSGVLPNGATTAHIEPADLNSVVGQFVVLVTLMDFWHSRGIIPDALLGEGVGLVAAAHVAGLLSLQGALEVLLSAQPDVSEGAIPATYCFDQETNNDTIKTTIFPIYSAKTGHLLDLAGLQAALQDETASPVHLSDTTMQQLLADGYDLFVELGPQILLSQSLPMLSQKQSEVTLLLTLGRLYVSGYSINWSILSPEGRRCVSLPTYPWQRERVWLDWLDVDKISTPPESRFPDVQDQASSQEKQDLSLLPPAGTASADQWRMFLRDYLKKDVSTVLEVDPTIVQVSQSFFSQGMDSLTATQLINQVQKNLGFLLSPATIFRYPTIERLADHLAQEILSSERHKQTSLSNLAPLSLRRLEELSEIETETLLTEKLAILEEILSEQPC